MRVRVCANEHSARLHMCAQSCAHDEQGKPLINSTLVTCTSQIYNIHLPQRESAETNDVTNIVENIERIELLVRKVVSS